MAKDLVLILLIIAVIFGFINQIFPGSVIDLGGKAWEKIQTLPDYTPDKIPESQEESE